MSAQTISNQHSKFEGLSGYTTPTPNGMIFLKLTNSHVDGDRSSKNDLSFLPLTSDISPPNSKERTLSTSSSGTLGFNDAASDTSSGACSSVY